MSTNTNAVTIEAPEGLPFIEITREFDAPVAALFEAHRDPALVKQWLGPNGYEMDIERWDFSTQGGYRYVHRDADGGAWGFNGTFHSVRENEFAVQTFEFEGFPDVVAIETIAFEDLGGGRARLRIHSTYPSVEARDGMVASDMETGVSEGYARLEALAAELAAAETSAGVS
ncbi:SRPBCC family protein [Agromyces sp. LHK192]|uniref:SRPBCC family protein n=1 Tax=Agromyces sp. LHK192 TaxID=2498704 RepID=UPI000FD87B95|nr:SRPBCC family protein [Agromyces sp. LHK192]